MRVCLHAKAAKFRCVCVYLEISVNTRSFKNCSTHNSYLFHPCSVWFLLQQTKCSTKFYSPNKLLREILLTQTKFWAKFRCLWNKMPCEISHVCTNFNDMGTIGESKYRRKFAFFEISHNFGKFRRNSLSLLLHNTVKLYVPARWACCIIDTVRTHFVIYTVSVS